MINWIVRGCRTALAFVVVLSFVSSVANAQGVTLAESDDSSRVIQNRISIAVEGNQEAADLGSKSILLPLKVTAAQDYYARRLPSAGRDERAFRDLRYYVNASVDVKSGDQATRTVLPKVMNLIVAEGMREGVFYYSPEYVISRRYEDLLRMPGDPLALLPFLPKTPVELNQSWPVDSWALSMLTETEAVIESKMNCQLTALTETTATITFQGNVEGVIVGANAKITINGTLTFDRKNNIISKIEYAQQENRAVGAASPGMRVGAKTIVERNIASKPELTDELAGSIPLDISAKSKMMHFQPSSWKIRFYHDRFWHVFQETAQVVVLRLMIDGSLVSQCNVATIPKVAPGEHTSGELFQADIQKSLGERLKQIVSAEEISNSQGNYIYRVVAEGAANGRDMNWIYYLVSAPDGRQVSLVFAVEPTRTKLLENRDLSIVQSIQFLNE